MKKFAIITFNLFCSMSLFSYGTAMMDYFLVYPSRHIVGEKEFIAYSDLLGAAIVPVSVLPFFAMTILNILLVWIRPASATRSLVIASLVCLILDWISTIFIQIPANIELGHGKDPALIQYVIDTNWGRVVLETLQAIIVFVLMMRVSTASHRTHVEQYA